MIPTRYPPYITPSFGPTEADMRATTKGGRTVPYPTAALPPRPSLSLLSDRAKALRKAHAAGDPDAIERVLRYHPAHEGTDASPTAAADLSTRDAQLVVAREHGFDNWTQLKRYVESLRHVDRAPTRIGKAVPFFGVSDMDAALGHYVARLGFRMARSWAPDGKVRWCWLELGPAALMLQQYDTEGANARPFEGRRGAGGAFVVVADPAAWRSSGSRCAATQLSPRGTERPCLMGTRGLDEEPSSCCRGAAAACRTWPMAARSHAGEVRLRSWSYPAERDGGYYLYLEGRKSWSWAQAPD